MSVVTQLDFVDLSSFFLVGFGGFRCVWSVWCNHFKVGFGGEATRAPCGSSVDFWGGRGGGGSVIFGRPLVIPCQHLVLATGLLHIWYIP